MQQNQIIRWRTYQAPKLLCHEHGELAVGVVNALCMDLLWRKGPPMLLAELLHLAEEDRDGPVDVLRLCLWLQVLVDGCAKVVLAPEMVPAPFTCMKTASSHSVSDCFFTKWQGGLPASPLEP